MVYHSVRLCLVTQFVSNSLQPHDCSPPGSSVHGDSPGKNTGVGGHALLRGLSQSRDRTQPSCTVGRFCTIWATREDYWWANMKLVYGRQNNGPSMMSTS